MRDYTRINDLLNTSKDFGFVTKLHHNYRIFHVFNTVLFLLYLRQLVKIRDIWLLLEKFLNILITNSVERERERESK